MHRLWEYCTNLCMDGISNNTYVPSLWSLPYISLAWESTPIIPTVKMNDCILEPRLFQVACSSDTPQFWHHAPINVMPAGGRQGMGWGFDFLKKFTIKFPAHGQITPVKCNQISPPPGCILLSIPRRNLRKAQSFMNVAASPKIHVPVTAAFIRFNHNPYYTA